MPENKCAALIKTTLVDYPGIVASTVFFKGCNLRCPYCYNVNLVNCNDDTGLFSFEEIVTHLKKRAGIIQGLVISGGEALLNQNTVPLIEEAKKLGYKIKLDTNGTCFTQLKNLLSDNHLQPDYVAMDIKTSIEKYHLLNPIKNYSLELITQNIKDSCNLLSQLPAEKREWRTVLVPNLVSKDDIIKMSQLLPDDASWYFAKFINESCLDSKYNQIQPYSDKEYDEIVTTAQQYIKNAKTR